MSTAHSPTPADDGSLRRTLRPTLVLFAALTLLTGVVYPLVVTGIADLLFPDQAGGSLVMRDGRAVGSSLIGQPFSDPRYLWSRPSATSPMAYNGGSSSGSNQGPLNPALVDAVKSRIEALKAADPGNPMPVPVDLVTASGSGLDPHLSPAAAHYQAGRIARARSLPSEVVKAVIDRHTEERTFGVLGERRVNVLAVNLDLDRTPRR